MATSFELHHYLTIARPTIVLVDAALEPNVVKAMQTLAPELHPKHVLLLGGNDVSRSVGFNLLLNVVLDHGQPGLILFFTVP